MVVPNSKPTLICTVWTEKLYNLESFRSHTKGIWKTRKKFEIQMVGQNLFLIIFKLEEDLETILEGRPWLFSKSIILDQIRLTSSPFWIKIDSFLPEFDKKDLLHAIGATFGGVIISEYNKEFCQPLRQGIFVSIDNVNKVWVPFKYENLPMFCFGCGKMGHGLSNCTQIIPARKSKISENPPYTLALKAESKLIEKESMKFNVLMKQVGAQCSYTGKRVLPKNSKIIESENNEVWGSQENIELMGEGVMQKEQECLSRIKEVEKLSDCTEKKGQNPINDKKVNWKGIKTAATITLTNDENNTRKRKSLDADLTRCDKETVD
ncbi:hypothetical protein GOBAR_DD27286 [Gossypium barbadense]|nr:hypothetical protein GOBAR_DD27286 [Gossypium barbadense]